MFKPEMAMKYPVAKLPSFEKSELFKKCDSDLTVGPTTNVCVKGNSHMG